MVTQLSPQCSLQKWVTENSDQELRKRNGLQRIAIKNYEKEMSYKEQRSRITKKKRVTENSDQELRKRNELQRIAIKNYDKEMGYRE